MVKHMEQKIGICGLGLIGGSLAKAFRNKCNVKEIAALDQNEKALEKALEENIITKASTHDYKLFKDCDIIFVCTPINAVVGAITEISKVSKGLITDTASTKAQIMEQINESCRFIGGHPMAGSETSGYSGASETLFENAMYILCKAKVTDSEDFEMLKKIIEMIGAIPLELTPQEHDKAAGILSHLPHIAAASLVNIVGEKDQTGKLLKLAAGGFKDITRIASSNADLWQQIILSSGDTITNILEDYIKTLQKFSKALKNKNAEAVNTFFSEAKTYRDHILESSSGLIPSNYQLLIEVSDRPGIIGSVTTILGDNGINIKNLYIQNNREYEGGCLRITIEQASQAQAALEILQNNGFRCQRG